VLDLGIAFRMPMVRSMFDEVCMMSDFGIWPLQVMANEETV
jgi:hypothetical protein